jgi:hypothetical protein
MLIRPASADDPGVARQHLNPATEKARLLKVQSGHAVWLTSELDPKTAMHRAQTFTHRFYRQRLGEQKADLVYHFRDTSVEFIVGIREDGSVVLASRMWLHYVPVAGVPSKQDLGSHECLAVYPDGLLAKDWARRDPKSFQPVYFVPFDGERLRLKDPVQVVDAGVKNFSREDGLGYAAEPYRAGSLLAWVADSTLHTFDLKSRERKAVKLATELGRGYTVTAFDGKSVLSGLYAFDAASGKVLGEPDYAKAPRNVGSVFAVRNQIGYYYEGDSLRATDLTSKDGASIRVRVAQAVMPLIDDKGLTVWDGKQWAHVAWLTELRRP